MDSCPCFSQKPYEECCKPFHDGKTLPANALELMRSRYAAYALHKADYIIQTTHPKNRSYEKDLARWKENILMFCLTTQFKGLEIVEFIAGQKQASVTFIAYLENQGKDVSFKEKSLFEKVDGRWLYKEGLLKQSLTQSSGD
jgi:SEC-C motif domain protein